MLIADLMNHFLVNVADVRFMVSRADSGTPEIVPSLSCSVCSAMTSITRNGKCLSCHAILQANSPMETVSL